MTENAVLFFNGAISGSGGGPKVKVKRLKNLFKSSRFNPNIIYCLSNCIYSYNYIIEKYIKFKIPIIYNQNGIFHKVWYKGDIGSKNKEMEFYLKNSDYVFYQSKFCKKCCDQIIYKRTKDFKILYNAVNTNFFFLLDAKETSCIPILKIGIYNQENAWRLVDSIETIHKANQLVANKFSLSIVGPIDKLTRKRIYELVDKYNMSKDIFLIGKTHQNKLVEIMQRHKILLSTKIYDPCSNSIIEAMACGLPVIFHNSGGNFELVKDAGWSFGEKLLSIKTLKINKSDLLSILTNITIQEIPYKSKLARLRAEKYFNISKWEIEHRKAFKFATQKINNKN